MSEEDDFFRGETLDLLFELLDEDALDAEMDDVFEEAVEEVRKLYSSMFIIRILFELSMWTAVYSGNKIK